MQKQKISIHLLLGLGDKIKYHNIFTKYLDIDIATVL